MASSSGSIYSPDTLKSMRHYHFVRHWGKEVVYKIYNLCFLEGQNKRIREILEDSQVPLKGKKSPFNPQEIQNLTDKPPEDLDITVMYKTCQALWEKGVNDPGDETRGLVKKIKDESKIVSYEVTYMSDTDLESILRDFQATLKETLEKTKSLFPKHSADIDLLKAEIQNAVPKLQEKIREKYDSSNPQDVQRLKEELKEFGSELFDMIQESSEAELLSLNERLCQILPYDWLAQHGTTDPGNIMVSLQVVDDQELNKGPLGNKSVNQKEILNKDKMGKDPEVVILSGDAGSGKTTILRSYAEGWCKKTTDMPELSSFPLLLNMQFRNHDHDNFDDYLKSLIPKTIAQFPFDLVKSVVLGSKCLVLCDGYDEYNINSRKLFGNILALASNKMKFVVTTRPGNTEELTKIVNQGKRSRINLKVSGLQKKDMKLLAEKLIGHLMKDDDVTQQEQMKKEVLQKIAKMETGTRNILQTPLYFNLFSLLYIECPDLRDELSTNSSVYLQLRKHKIKRISDKTGISEKSLEEFDALCRKWSLKYCIEEKYEWSEADVRSFKMEINSPELLQNFEAIMSSYFSIKNTKKQQEIVKVYCHRHRSEQEFAAAGSICDDIITSIGRRPQGGGNFIRDLLQAKGLWDGRDLKQLFRKFRGVLAFITGILYTTERAVLYDTIRELIELYVSCCLSYDGDKDDDDKDDDDKDDGDNDDNDDGDDNDGDDDNDDGDNADDDNDGDDDNDDGDNDNADDDNDDGDNDNADDDNGDGDNGDADDDNDNDDGDDDDGDDDNDDGDNDNADNDDGDNDNADDDNDDGDTDDNGDDDGDNDDNDDAGDDDNDDGDDDDDDNDNGDDDNDDGDDDNDCTQDILSDILFETRLDPKVLGLLVSEMERGISLRNSVTFKEPKSLYVLPFLLPRLRPREIVLKFRHSEVSKNLSALNKTLESAFWSRKMIYIRMDLSEFKQLAGQEEVLHPVDYLRLDVREDGYEELESLHHPFSLLTSSADELRLRYFMFYAPEDRIAQVMNRTLALTSRVEGGATDLVIQFMKDLDVELLLQLLTLPPLRELVIWPHPDTTIDDVEELRTICRGRGIQTLSVVCP